MKKSKKKFNTTEYTYYKYDPATKRDVPVKIVAGQNGVTEEYITMLREMDEANRIADEREERHRDKGFEAKKNRAALNDDGTAYDPFNEIADKSADPANQPEPDTVDKIELMRKFMKELTEEQITLIYQIYGMNRRLSDIAGECGVSKQAIANRRDKIIARLTKLLDGTKK